MRQGLHQPTVFRADRAIPRASPVASVTMKIGMKGRVAKWDAHSAGPTHDLATLVLPSLPTNENAVLAISGGLDSMALLDLAATARKRRGCALVVATFDHSSGAHS